MKFRHCFAAAALLLAIAAAPALAAGEEVDVYGGRQKLVKSVVFVIGVSEYFVNNQTPGIKMDAKSFMRNDRTFVPVRYLGYALGVTPDNINWDNSQQKATLKLGENTVEMRVGKKQITANSQNKDIDVAPVLNEKEGRTYLPARYIAEGLGYEVDWDDQSQAVLCWPKGTPKPDIISIRQYVQNLAQQQPPQEQTDKYADYKPRGKVEIVPDGGGMVDTNEGGEFDPSKWTIVH